MPKIVRINGAHAKGGTGRYTNFVRSKNDLKIDNAILEQHSQK